jgi:hypothetical protein
MMLGWLCGLLAVAAPPKLVPVRQGGVELGVPEGWTVSWTDQSLTASPPSVTTPESYGFVSVVWVKYTGQYHQMMLDSVQVSYEQLNPVFQGKDDRGGYTVVLRTPSGATAFYTAIHLQQAGKDELYCTALGSEASMTVGEVVQFARQVCGTVRTGSPAAGSPPRPLGPAGVDIAGTWAVSARGENPRLGGGTLTLSDTRYVLALWATDGNVLLHEVGNVKASAEALMFVAEGRGGGTHSFLLLDDGGTLVLSGNCPVARACGEPDVFRARRVASTAR